jgi:putative sugar O-methyltransferase
VHPVHNPEQQRVSQGPTKGLLQLISDIESRLGFRIHFPDAGAPYGVTIDGRLITLETPEQIYGALRLDQAINLHLADIDARSPRIVEIGGGYGAMCYWFLQMSATTANYTIVDLPIINLLQGYFLAQALGHQIVSFYGEPARRVTLLPVSARAEIEVPFHVLVNKDSMPEMPYDTVVDYLGWGRANCDGFFLSYNHESASDFQGHLQGRVSETVDQSGSFRRLRRDRSWVRPGYVEEVYAPRSSLSDEPNVTQ